MYVHLRKDFERDSYNVLMKEELTVAITLLRDRRNVDEKKEMLKSMWIYRKLKLVQ